MANKRFMVLIFDNEEETSKMTEDQSQEHMQKWFSWHESLGSKALDGDGIHPNALVLSGKDKTKNYMPFAHKHKEFIVSGYYIIEASSLEDAAEIMKDCPVFEVEGTLEFREIMTQEDYE